MLFKLIRLAATMTALAILGSSALLSVYDWGQRAGVLTRELELEAQAAGRDSATARQWMASGRASAEFREWYFRDCDCD